MNNSPIRGFPKERTEGLPGTYTWKRNIKKAEKKRERQNRKKGRK